MPGNFIIASHPDFSTALIFITLPAGLILLGFVRQIIQGRIIFTIIVTIITLLEIYPTFMNKPRNKTKKKVKFAQV
jgi:cell division protein FtsW (lipid II flippase)